MWSKFRILCLVICVMMLQACSTLSFLGDFEDEEILEGDRIAVLKLDTKLKADPLLQDKAVQLPFPKTNTRWYKSGTNHYMIEQNPAAPWNITKQQVVDIGSGGVSKYRLSATPIIFDEKVVTLDGQGLVTARNATNIGQKLWQTKIVVEENRANSVNGGLTYRDGRVFVTTGYNVIVALDAKTGKALWKRVLNSITRSAPEAYDNQVFVTTVDNKLYAMKVEDGTIEWSHSGIAEDVGVLGAASPTAADDLVVVPYSSGEIYGLKRRNGSVRWLDSLALASSNTAYALSDVDASPIVRGGAVFAVSNSGVLAATDLNSGMRLWDQEASTTHTPWLAASYIYLITSKQELVAIEARSGRIRWVSPLPTYLDPEKPEDTIRWNGPVMGSGRLLVTSSHGQLRSYSPIDGGELQRFEIPEDVYLPPVVAHDSIYLLTNDGELVRLLGSVKEPAIEDLQTVGDAMDVTLEEDGGDGKDLGANEDEKSLWQSIKGFGIFDD